MKFKSLILVKIMLADEDDDDGCRLDLALLMLKTAHHCFLLFLSKIAKICKLINSRSEIYQV